MRQLLNVLYVTTPDSYLCLDGENVVIRAQEKELGRVPIHNLEGMAVFGYQGISPALMRHFCEMGKWVSFLSPTGRFLASVNGEMKGNVLLRKEQYRISDSESRSLDIAKHMIGAKTANSKTVIQRFTRDHPFSTDNNRLAEILRLLSGDLPLVKTCGSLDSLRGIEGLQANRYFSVFGELILQEREFFRFAGREKRPPKDPMNALLSFVYSLCANECASALSCAGLDPYVGFLHTDRPGRKSLALDLMEELRAPLCDRFVLSIINQKQIGESDFVVKENGTVLLKEEPRKKLLVGWQEKKKEALVHPFLDVKVSWGLIPIIQAQLLARYIRGDLDGYPPFLWR